MNSDNRRRAFADVVTVEAWHNDFANDVTKVDLHADVVFGTARMGGEIDAPVRFRLSIRRAELIIVIPELEPVAVDTQSVSRDAPKFEGRITKRVQAAKEASVKSEASLALDPAILRASISSELHGQISGSQSRQLELTQSVTLMIVTQSRSPDGHYRWLIEATDSEPLAGRPWNAQEQPRLKLIDKRSDRTKGIPPTVRVEVKCRREDLVIEDLQLKDESLWDSLVGRAGHKNRVAAAISYIRSRLAEENLEVDNMEDVFGQITLASTIAQSS